MVSVLMKIDVGGQMKLRDQQSAADLVHQLGKEILLIRGS